MEMSFVYLVAFLLLLCTYARTQEQQPDACNEESWPCPALSHNTTSEYAFNLSSTDYLEAQKIVLKVYMTSCPTPSTNGSKWYKLEAISQVTSTAVGTFQEPHRRSEAHLCRNKTAVVFSACETNPLDLPRKYSWTAPTTNAGTICFRLTILTDGDSSCYEVETCIEPVESPDNSTVPNDTESGQHAQSSSPIGIPIPKAAATQPNKCEKDCSDAKMKVFCGSDGRTYQSRCEKRIQECLTNTIIHLTQGPCPTLPTTPCLSQDSEWPWTAACDYRGMYKPIQCSKESTWTCWCSSETFGSREGPRRDVTCTDPEEPFELDCF